MVWKEITPKLNLKGLSTELTMLNTYNHYKFKMKQKCHWTWKSFVEREREMSFTEIFV